MPELPLELERQIFELAFKPNSRDIALKVTLCLVARRVQVWIDRIFYELVTISDEDRGKRFLSLIQSNAKPPDFFAVVKTLCLTYAVDDATACGILAACNRVESLACWVETDAPQLPLLISQLPLHRLSIRMDHFLRIPFGAPPSSYLSDLTHIELRRWDPSHLSQLVHLPRLTHVCLPSRDYSQIRVGYTETVCSSCPRLQVLIILCDSTIVDWVEATLPLSAKADHRVVVQAKLIREELREDWEGSYFGRSDKWCRAEATVAQRKSSVGQK
ncbi:hypothetical protein DFH08DRAFT_838980 [Mycena albidolilacea]|uniref:Uncharacterized protein n=1 Tax=Mycena albidolilacea TaxID=1033008 RepID=A0AAD7ANV2_9AGAR|nr:hypothetical protein DFH08DRAFT_838980 [Mycena albidolilacea]